MAKRFWLLAILLAGCGPAPSDPGVVALVGGTVYPVTSDPIPEGVVVFRDGKIEAVGADVPIPPGATVVDATGMSVIPGIVESHSHMGFKQLNLPGTGSNNNELSSPINAHVRAIDGLDSSDPAFALALAAGITTQNITPGSRSPNSGQAALVKMRGGTIENMYWAHGGMKFAIRATTPYPNFPRDERGVFELLRSELEASREYVARVEAHEADPANPLPPRDLTREAFGKLLRREWPVGVHSNDVEQMGYAIELKKLFDLDLYVHHGGATLQHAEEMHRENIGVSFGPILPFDSRESDELMGPVRLAEMGGVAAFHQDHPDGHQYFLRHTAAMFVRRGMSPADALRGLTWSGARLFSVEDRIGALEPGMDADVVIVAGEDPLAYENLVMRVFVDGVEVFDRERGYNVFGQRVPDGW